MAKFSDYFNSTTIRGRANVAKATYASLAALYLYTRYKRNKVKHPDNSINEPIVQNHEQMSEDIENLEHTNLERADKKVNEQPETTPPAEYNTSIQNVSPSKPDHNEDVGVEIAEAVVKSAELKSHYGGNHCKEGKVNHLSDSPPPDEGSCQ